MTEGARVLALVTARGGSKGLPGKNVRPLGGRPLVAWSVDAALASGVIDRVIVSTDDDAIADAGREAGAEVPFRRPAELASDTASHADVVAHALAWLDANEGYRPSHLVLLQPTSPLRTAEDVRGGVTLCLTSGADAVVGVCEAREHPYLVRALDDEGRLRPFVASDLAYARRQDLPPAYVLNGALYVNRVEALLRARDFSPPGARAWIMPRARSVDIDDAHDFAAAEALLMAR